MNIQQIQKVLRKAIKDYEIAANVDEETLVAFLSVDIVREEHAPTITPKRRLGGE